MLSGAGPGGALGGTLGVDAIQEFTVVTSNATSDYGRTSGGVARVDDDLRDGLSRQSAAEVLQRPVPTAVLGDKDPRAVVAIDSVVRLARAGVNDFVALLVARFGNGPHEQGHWVAAAIEHVDRVLLDQTKGQLEFAAARGLLELDHKPCQSILLVEFFDGVADRLDALVWGLTELLVEPMPSYGIFEVTRQRAMELRSPPPPPMPKKEWAVGCVEWQREQDEKRARGEE